MHLIKTVDDGRVAADPFKLPALLRTQHDADLTGLETADSDTALTESDRAGGSATARKALDTLGDLAREGFKFIDAIRATQITDAQRLEVFTAYGWASGKLGRFNDARVIGLSRLGALAHTDVAAPFRYPADLIADIKAQLAIFDANAQVATGGDRQKATETRDTKLDAANTTVSQVRFFYCSSSRDTDQSPELAKIGCQPRRPAGTVDHPEKKSAPAPAPKP
ncbi:MAG: hypothetical protein EPO07_06865 [Verrucomicrobia bacterium]|nr:MAG: hypothetical protein EPO07_06865 [Verrucomicrobiota bacterium]